MRNWMKKKVVLGDMDESTNVSLSRKTQSTLNREIRLSMKYLRDQDNRSVTTKNSVRSRTLMGVEGMKKQEKYKARSEYKELI